MLDTKALHRLAEIDTHPDATLSLYLALDQPREARLLALGQMFKRKESQLSGNGSQVHWKTLAPDLDKATHLVEELPLGPDRGLALFACSKHGLFEAFTLPVSVPNLLELGPSPYIRPLTALAGDHRRTLVVVLDRRSARFFHGFLGQVTEAETRIENQIVPVSRDGDQGRAGDNQLARRADQASNHYYKEVVQALMQQFKDGQFQELLVGGSKSAVEGLTAALHPYLAQRLAGTFTCDTGASLGALSEEVDRVQTLARRQRQERLLANLADNLGPNGQAATGLNQVLAALHEGKVHTLLVQRGFARPGGVCSQCGRLRHVAGACPLCHGAMTAVDDVVNLALARALDSGAAVEQVEGQSPLDDMGAIAALLRYA